ncbi:hypothetical protein [Nesterenkonia pannonica]|uniref:hypothetical protein n=1 Tax=Nesterenkonia pannonica TaxID=1548602 RepID=UPI002164C3E1|nr:hypothetical protein [Nesterenkonia pannonica]
MIDEARRQAALDSLNVLYTPPDERVDRITRLAQEIFGVPMVSVNLIDRDRQWSKSSVGLDVTNVPARRPSAARPSTTPTPSSLRICSRTAPSARAST